MTIRTLRKLGQCAIEVLEDRRMLSVTAASLAFPLTSGVKWTTVDTSDNSTDSYTVIGNASFNGYSGTKITDVYSDGTPSDTTNTDTYAGYDSSKNFVVYGDVTTTTDDSTDPPTTDTATTTYDPPYQAIPAVLVAGTTYTSSSEATATSGSTTETTTVNLTTKLISDVKQKIVVPAGTYYCYEIYQTQTYIGAKNTITLSDYEWFATGIGSVKDISSEPSQPDDTTELQSWGGPKLPAKQLSFDQPPTAAKLNTALSPAVSVDVEDENGTVLTDDKSSVTLAIASGPSGGAISGTATATVVDGEATFSNLKFTKAGTYTLRATDGSLTAAVSGAFVIGSGTSTQLGFVTQPSNAITGKSIAPAVTVAVEESDGSTNTDDTSSVSLSIESGPVGGALSGTTTTAAVDGVASFSNLSLNVPGTYTLKADDGSLTSASSTSFTISSNASASKLAFAVQPTTTVAGKTIAPSVKVDVEYPGGAIVATDSSTVTLALASGTGTLAGTLTAKAVNGVATFSSLMLTKAGSYSLSATDAKLTAATSATFAVTAAAAAKLVFAASPASATVGKAITPAVVVDVEDSFGNIATTNTSTVTLSLGSGTAALGGTLTAAAKAGVATFSNVIVTKTGSVALKAADGSLTSATTKGFNAAAGTAAKLIFSVEPKTTVAGKAIAPALVVDIEDASGNILTTSTSNVTISLSSGPSTPTGTLTVAAKAGVATFADLVLTKTGTYILKAADGAITASSSSFTVTPATASKLVFAVTPGATTAGKTLSGVNVDIEDQYGNIVTSSTSPVTLAIASGPTGAVLTGTLTLAAKAGVASFTNLVLTKAGSYKLKATGSGVTIANSSSFTIAAAVASKLAFSATPTGTVAGKTIASVTVKVEDQYGNVVTGDASKITLAIGSGPTGATLAGTLTETVKAGLATFANLVLTEAGSYKFKATDSSLTPANSSAFSITAATASKLVFKQQPGSSKIGKAISPAVTLLVEDSYGNIVTTDKSTVKLAIASGPTGGALTGVTSATASAGLATFSDLLLSKAGSYKLKATDGSLSTITSGSFTVS